MEINHRLIFDNKHIHLFISIFRTENLHTSYDKQDSQIWKFQDYGFCALLSKRYNEAFDILMLGLLRLVVIVPPLTNIELCNKVCI
jgi:hypothetical protein